ncbi:MAG: hypothetical protein PHU23_13415 [Dehalococcoidales bacterium]|nr:hypothetical protein [Dehalococcoidales bacterium]
MKDKKISLQKGKVINIRHTLKISIAKELPDSGIVSWRHVTIWERLFKKIFGDKRWLTVIVPGDSVKEMSIVEEGGGGHE